MADPTQSSSTANADDFKAALGTWASGVSVVTSRKGGLGYGLTVSAFNSVSLDPPLVLVCLKSVNCITPLIRDAGVFGVSVLATGQDAISNHFASRGREPAADLGGDVELTEGELGIPLVQGAAAHLECRLHSATPAGDHTIVIGTVVRCAVGDAEQPLVYWNRAYRRMTA